MSAERRIVHQCRGCGRFIKPYGEAWATGYHPDCEPSSTRRTPR